jgi:ppGpp synthetase/RelA/SpoT-type nucleotidyltranferase
MRTLGILLLCLLQASCAGQAINRINGISFVANQDRVTQEHIDKVLSIHANHAAVMPFGFIGSLDSPQIVFNTDRQWYGETREGGRQYIEMLHKNGIEVMLKPQIWIRHGEFTGTLKMESEEDWKGLEESYESFILMYAQLAEETKSEIFCIGTELEQFVKHRPEYWTKLIEKIKKIYKGKLTYAANWDEYTRTPFWKQLDYIGVDAYFPLSEEKTPTVEQLRKGWQKWKVNMRTLSEKIDRPILFTEFGYRSMDFTAKKPWLVDRNEENVNLEGQVNAKKAIFAEFWSEDWFSGGYIWKWFIWYDKVGGVNDNRFTPQNKPAEKVIADFYKVN